jgi:Cu(I)/Ag(I) efflux system membrane fusion protein/cobalt-zinc-cadmium efflux system membrane fusion protein
MSLFEDDSTTTSRKPRRLLGNLAWVGLGAAITWVLLANPLGLAGLDVLRHRLLSDHPVAAPQETAGAKQLWTCGMHPQVMQDEPGICPICEMDLVPMRDTERQPESRPAAKQLWTCGMHPQVIEEEPGVCPICEMDLVPMRSDEAEQTSEPQGAPSVTIDPAVVQNMNVRTQPVERSDLAREIRTVGYLEYDQQKMVSVTTKYPGWIEKVHVNYVGEPVRKGQPLFEIYSPELVQTEQDLLSALEFAGRMEQATPDAQRRAQDLVEAARRRLAYWDIASEQVDRLESTHQVFRTLTVTSPAGGVVMKRMPGLEGMAAKPGMELFHIADLSSLWLSVEAFEDQLAWLKVGSMAEVTLSYFPGETFTGRVRYIEPQVNEKTRTVPLKLELPNRDRRLRAGMYATVRFRAVVAREAVLVPTLAVLRTGQRNLVIVAEAAGRFTPREVELGAEGNGEVEVVSGLAAGERIVTSAQFLIDSESNLREAVQKLLASRSSESPAAVGHQH